MVDLNKNTDEYVSALFDDALTEEEAQQVIDILLQDESAQKRWQQAVLICDTVKSAKEPALSGLDVSESVMAKLNQQDLMIAARDIVTKEALRVNKNAANQIFRFIGAAASVMLVCTAVWNFWPTASEIPTVGGVAISEGNISASGEIPVDAVVLRETDEELQQRQKEIGEHYLQEHQDALLTVLDSGT
ncbi:RseA family anti-sigma factor [Neisseria sp. Ec49-e6-T10]|uniref:RseA family anti-sigma factor n=1 Tax=Neisseria sp. Ec49-e6-T10 TaxID=3140744 RepID=UPI003EBCC276